MIFGICFQNLGLHHRNPMKSSFPPGDPQLPAAGRPTCRAARTGLRPIASWFVMENPMKIRMISRGTPISGNLHIKNPLSNRVADSCKSSASRLYGPTVIHNFIQQQYVGDCWWFVDPHWWECHISITGWASLTSKAARPFSLRGLKKPLKDVEGRWHSKLKPNGKWIVSTFNGEGMAWYISIKSDKPLACRKCGKPETRHYGKLELYGFHFCACHTASDRYHLGP